MHCSSQAAVCSAKANGGIVRALHALQEVPVSLGSGERASQCMAFDFIPLVPLHRPLCACVDWLQDILNLVYICECNGLPEVAKYWQQVSGHTF